MDIFFIRGLHLKVFELRDFGLDIEPYEQLKPKKKSINDIKLDKGRYRKIVYLKLNWITVLKRR